MPEDITEVSLIIGCTDLQDETVKKFKQMLKETNEHIDTVEPSQIQPPSSHNQPTSHDNQPSTSALTHFPDSLRPTHPSEDIVFTATYNFESVSSFKITNVATKYKNRHSHKRSHEVEHMTWTLHHDD